jgi:hypothetical protein
MVNFKQDISNFTRFGTYNYQFDEVGNEILNPSSSIFQQNYFSFSLTDLNYDQQKILSFYNPTFTEFIKPVTQSDSASVSLIDVQQQLATAQSENSQLQIQLNELIALSDQSSNSANQQSVKDIIIGLRIQMGQGKVVGDFNSNFPYAPLPPDEQASNQSVS